MSFSPARSCTLLACQVAVPRVLRCAQDKFDHIDRMIDKISGHLDAARQQYTFLEDRLTDYRSR